mmetsp:Transcript_24488/g.40272  ORF Transcript_24488/g.40272 Transcript_24488/m.40272 type:complete len:113 (+) Transcript_24488:909-1247(+)
MSDPLLIADHPLPPDLHAVTLPNNNNISSSNLISKPDKSAVAMQDPLLMYVAPRLVSLDTALALHTVLEQVVPLSHECQQTYQPMLRDSTISAFPEGLSIQVLGTKVLTLRR